MSGRKAIIIAARRTAIGKIGGLHAKRRVEALAAPVIRAVLTDARLDSNCVDEVILGNAVGGGGNPARLATLAAGIAEAVPAFTIDRQCTSGLDAIVTGARMIETGAAEAIIAGGAESASTAPWRLAKPADLYTKLPHFFTQPSFAPDNYGDPGMIESAETIACLYKISRERQDSFALESHRRAVEARKSGVLEGEITPLAEAASESIDEGPRTSLSIQILSRMRPITASCGTVTAGNSCQINDGAAAVLLVSEELHERLGSPAGLVFAGAASAGIEPNILGLASVPASKKLAQATGLNFGDVDAIELNEAFAAQVLANIDLLGLDEHRVNTMGGALAYGHPHGASGALLVVRLFTRLTRQRKRPKASGVAMIAAAGGVGVAALFQSINVGR